MAAVSSRPFADSELAFLSEVTGTPWTLEAADAASCGPIRYRHLKENSYFNRPNVDKTPQSAGEVVDHLLVPNLNRRYFGISSILRTEKSTKAAENPHI